MNLHTISSQVATLHGENNPLIPNREIDDATVDLDLGDPAVDARLNPKSDSVPSCFETGLSVQR